MNNVFTFHTFTKASKLLKRILIISLFLFIAIFLYIMSSIAINQVRKSIENQYIEDGENIVRSYTLSLQNFISQAYLTLDLYSSAEIIRTGSSAQISHWLTENRSLRPQTFINIFYSDKNGNAWTDNGEYVNVKDRSYFREIMNERTIYHLDTAVLSKTTGKTIFHVSKAVYDNAGNLKGLISGSIECLQLQKILANAQVTNTMSPFILDQEGIFLSHSKNSMIMKSLDPNTNGTHFLTSLEVANSDPYFFISNNSDGERVHVFTEKVKNTTWTVGVSVLDEQIFGTYRSLARAKNLVFLIVIIAALLFYLLTLVIMAYLKRAYESTSKRDPLTELLTRQNFEQQATTLIEKNPTGKFVLIETDIVGFKFINRNYGDKVGNETLVNYANALKDLLFIYGGIACRGYADHFYYFNQVKSLARVVTALHIANQKIEEMIVKGKFPFTPKHGISFMTPEKEGDINSGTKSIQQLIGEASIAKNTIKRDNDTNYAIFNSHMAKRVQQEQKIERTMEKALTRGEFFVVYQPKIDLVTDKIMGAEALVRWNSPELGFLAPDKFIPLFESNGFIKKLDFAVYEMVFKFLRRQLDNNEPVVPISVNMSRNHINTNLFMREFLKRIEKYDIPPYLVEIEILERSVNNEKPILQEITAELHKHGFSVAMDDFGSGESSLNMLNSVPIDVLKFDQNFLKNNPDTEQSAQFITTLIKMAQQMQKKTVFEGVETESQRDFLKSIKCDSVQGFFYSKPLLEEDFIKFIKAHV